MSSSVSTHPPEDPSPTSAESLKRFIEGFERSLRSLRCGPSCTSRAEVADLTQRAIDSCAHFKHTVHAIEKFVRDGDPDAKITGLYVMDSLMRHSRHQLCEGDAFLFIDRFGKNMSQTLSQMKACGGASASAAGLMSQQVRRLVEVWRRNRILSESHADEVIGSLSVLSVDHSEMTLNERIEWMLSNNGFSREDGFEKLSDLPPMPPLPVPPAPPPRHRRRRLESPVARRQAPEVPIRDGCVSVCSRTVWIGHLPKNLYEQDLESALQSAGGVEKMKVIPPRGCAYVCFKEREDGRRFVTGGGRRPFAVRGIQTRVAWASNMGVKDRRGQFDTEHGCTYIPWADLDGLSGEALLRLADGGLIEEATASQDILARMNASGGGAQRNHQSTPPTPTPVHQNNGGGAATRLWNPVVYGGGGGGGGQYVPQPPQPLFPFDPPMPFQQFQPPTTTNQTRENRPLLPDPPIQRKRHFEEHHESEQKRPRRSRYDSDRNRHPYNHRQQQQQQPMNHHH